MYRRISRVILTDASTHPMTTLTRKGYARIYTLHEVDVGKVRDIIEEMDEFEYVYLPDHLIAPFSKYPVLSYTHKFDGLDMNALTAICWSRGIPIWVCDNGFEEFMVDATKKQETN